MCIYIYFVVSVKSLILTFLTKKPSNSILFYIKYRSEIKHKDFLALRTSAKKIKRHTPQEIKYFDHE